MPAAIKKVNGFQVRTPGGIKAKSNPGPLQRIAQRGNAGRGLQGACGGTRREDGSGGGVGNVGTSRQPGRSIIDKIKKM